MRSKFCVCRILEMMHNFVRSANSVMKQIKLSNCTKVYYYSSSNSIQSDKICNKFLIK